MSEKIFCTDFVCVCRCRSSSGTKDALFILDRSTLKPYIEGRRQACRYIAE